MTTKKNNVIINKNDKFGRWTIIDETPTKPNGKNKIYYLCKCDCGTIKYVSRATLLNGTSVSCGCYNRDKLKEYYNGEFSIINTKDMLMEDNNGNNIQE